MNILVTGFGGYIGPVVVKHLKAAGHLVDAVDTGWFLPDYAEAPEWPHRPLFGDIRDLRHSDDGKDPDVVVHLAGLSNDPMGDLNPDLTRRINGVGTLDLIRLTPDSRHVIVSSCSVYGHTEEPATEQTDVHPLTPYAQAKAWVDYNAPLYAKNVVSLRLGTVWGYSPGHRLDLVVNRMMFDAIHREKVTATGNAWRPLVHVEDVARAILDFVESEHTGIHNIVGDNIQMGDLASLVADYVGATATVSDDTPDKRDYRAVSGFNTHHSVHKRDDLHDLWVQTSFLPIDRAGDGGGRYVRLNSLKRLKALGILDDDLRRKV